MKVRFSFAKYFECIIGVDTVDLVFPEGITIGSALEAYFDENPDFRRRLDEKNLFLLGDFRAIYHINRTVVKNDHILHDGDDLKILKAFIGG